uniref:Uncharacterized protein n=1 Tax=viral metagenome TaxID=1070528 RepID=A0A6C0KM18_9ZZZZ
MTSLFWSSTYQPRRIFGWRDILQNWNTTLAMPSYVTTVLNNLHLATLHTPDYPLSHFLDFVNNEQEGIAWLIYETISLRSLNGTIRLDYVKQLLDLVDDLDGPFPNFAGSPSGTIREFVNYRLTRNELDYVQMMPELISPSVSPPAHHYTHYMHLSRPSVTPAQHCTQVSRPSSSTQSFTIELRILRDLKNTSSSYDDVIRISKNKDGSYNIIYHDQSSQTKSKTLFMTRPELLKYLSNTLRLMTLDKEPFEAMQVIMPNAPSVLISIHDLTSQNRDLIYDTMESTMDNWPVKA